MYAVHSARRARSARARFPNLVSAAAAGVFAAACGGGGGGYTTAPAPPTQPASRNVVAASPSIAFTPAQITVALGDSVTWAFGSVAHTVVFESGSDTASDYAGKTSSPGAPANIASTANASAARVFTRKGSFNYRCTIHPGMLGTVDVQ